MLIVVFTRTVDMYKMGYKIGILSRNRLISGISTAQKMKFSIKDFFSKCDQIRRKLHIWSHLLKKSLMQNFFFCAVALYIKVLFHCLSNFRRYHCCVTNYAQDYGGLKGQHYLGRDYKTRYFNLGFFPGVS